MRDLEICLIIVSCVSICFVSEFTSCLLTHTGTRMANHENIHIPICLRIFFLQDDLFEDQNLHLVWTRYSKLVWERYLDTCLYLLYKTNI